MDGGLMRARVRLSPLVNADRDPHKQGHTRNQIALIDPGSDHSLIQFDLLPASIQRDIQAFNQDRHTPNLHNLRLHQHSVVKTINGEQVADSISITLNATIGRWHGPLEFIVLTELQNERFIIGSDFLIRHDAELSLAKEKEEMRLRVNSSAYCRSICNFRLGPNQEGHIEADVPRSFIDHDVIVQTLDHSNQGFTVASTVNRVNNSRIMLRYVNPTNRTIKISKGQQLAEIFDLTCLASPLELINANHNSINFSEVVEKFSPIRPKSNP